MPVLGFSFFLVTNTEPLLERLGGIMVVYEIANLKKWVQFPF